jgi:hypothetical protein
MAHAGSWGTRNDAYTAGQELRSDAEVGAATAPLASGGVALAERTRTSAVGATMRRPLNGLATVPYVIGGAVIVAEVFYRG